MTESSLWFYKEYPGASKALAGTCYGVTTHPGMDFLGYVSKTPDDRHWCYDDGTHCGRFMAGEGGAGPAPSARVGRPGRH